MKKRIVSFLLALVMAVSLLPVSAFAADGAYNVTEDTTVQRRDYADMIAVQAATEPEQVDGFYQIKTADDLVLFGEIAKKNSTASALLCNDIDMSTITTDFDMIGESWNEYCGVFNGNGHIISNLKYEDSSITGTNYALFKKTGEKAVIMNLGVSKATFSLVPSKGKRDVKAAVLVGVNKGSVYNCFVTDSQVVIKGKNEPHAGMLCAVNQGKIENCFCIGGSITDQGTSSKADIKGSLGGIAGSNSGTVKNSYAAGVTFAKRNEAKNDDLLYPIAPGTVENVYYIRAVDDTRTYTGGIEKDAAWLQSDAAVTALGEKYFKKDTDSKNSGYPVLTYYVDDSGSTKVDKSELKALLDAMPTDGYYTQDDRYNGKTTSTDGFWSDYQRMIASAKNVYNQVNVEQEKVDATVKTLKEDKDKIDAAIANLIPADRANTTALYEELQNAPSNSEDTYTAKSWAVYQAARDKAEALMAAMFDAEGNPTDDNKAAANKSIETMAAELETARKALNPKATDGNKAITSLNLEAIRYLAEQYEPDTLTGYTAESVQTLRDARAEALKKADEIDLSDLGQNGDGTSNALRELRKAIYGLTTTSAAQISVKVSVLDANDIYAGYTGEFAHLHNSNTYTASMTLDANASAYDRRGGGVPERGTGIRQQWRNRQLSGHS